MNVRLNEPGTHDNDRVNQLDFTVSKSFKSRGIDFRPEAAIFNMLNASPVTAQTNTYGANLGRVTSVLNARLVRVGFTAEISGSEGSFHEPSIVLSISGRGGACHPCGSCPVSTGAHRRPYAGRCARHTASRQELDTAAHAGRTARPAGDLDERTLTPLERLPEFAGKEYLTPQEAAEHQKRVLERWDRDNRGGGAAADLGRAYGSQWWDADARIVPMTRTRYRGSGGREDSAADTRGGEAPRRRARSSVNCILPTVLKTGH